MNLIETNFNNKRLGYPWVTLFLTLIFFGVILHIYLPNLGGSGLSLPLNIISNFSIALFIFLVSIIQLKRTTLFYSTASNLISIGLIIFIFICFFSPDAYRQSAYLTAYWILGILVFYQLLMQINFSEVDCDIILWGILLASVIESTLAIVQTFNLLPIAGLSYPPLSGERPYGIFQQVNVFSSFICVGIASAVGLIIKIKKNTWYSLSIIMISLILMSSVLPLSQSLTGYLSLFLVLIVFFIFARYYRKKILLALFSIIIGLILGYIIKIGLNVSDVSEMKLHTSHIRWVLWQHSLSLFSENFLWGTGVGSFESVFLERFGGNLISTSQSTMSHPHNEILRWMVEGGLIGLLGICFITLGVFYLLRSSLRRQNYIYLVIALPIFIHIMTEFPLWLSTPHGIVLILLLRCTDVSLKKQIIYKPIAIFSRSILALGGVFSITLLYLTLQAQQYLTYIEKTGSQSILSTSNPANNKWSYLLIADRYCYDLNMGYLLRYNETHDNKYLKLFDIWAEDYSLKHPDINVYYSWILVLNELDQKEKAKKIYKKAKWLFIKDERIEQINLIN